MVFNHWNQGIAPTGITALYLGWVTIDEESVVQRVAEATDLVFEGEQPLPVLRIHHVLKSKLMVNDVFHDELVLFQKTIGA